ncbi:hypothetical protein, partial [Bordetella pertussis]|uniref:hypothetical protein n=1 Tax=Bordetella pertussis TaxID=520 RepID=UPI0012B903FA
MRAATHPPLVLQQTQGGPMLAFGLTWFAVLGSHAALQRCRRRPRWIPCWPGRIPPRAWRRWPR